MLKFRVKNADSLLAKCKKAVLNLGYRIDKVDKINETIYAICNVSNFSWGNNIEIRIKKNKVSSTISINATNSVTIQIDFGKNKSIENALFEEIMKLVEL
ncbi:MAG: hypothetical protein Q8K92_06340 [Leadbetterella sp.]|nr:hypothetical protein [Leadbetterella sp.]